MRALEAAVYRKTVTWRELCQWLTKEEASGNKETWSAVQDPLGCVAWGFLGKLRRHSQTACGRVVFGECGKS